MEIAGIPIMNLLAYILLGVGGAGIGWPKLKELIPFFKSSSSIEPTSTISYNREIDSICKDPKITVFAVTNGLDVEQATNLCTFIKGLTNE
jgi:hypothetical protein